MNDNLYFAEQIAAENLHTFAHKSFKYGENFKIGRFCNNTILYSQVLKTFFSGVEIMTLEHIIHR